MEGGNHATGLENATIIFILKSEDVTDCNNYKGKCLPDMIYKMVATLVIVRFKAAKEPKIGNNSQPLGEGGNGRSDFYNDRSDNNFLSVWYYSGDFIH